jgi:hypothetical protein
MPPINWMPAGATFAAAMVMGVSLGSYATSQPRSALDEPMEEPAYAAGTFQPDAAAAMTGPVEVKCTGCGPTLEERRWRAETAGWDSGLSASDSRDPVVREYYTRLPDDDPSPTLTDEPRAPEVDPLPDNVARFARGEMTGQAARLADDMPSPPPLVRTASLQ